MPNFQGLTLKQAQNLALQNSANLKVDIQGQGQVVVAQSPAGEAKWNLDL
nr:PASTA domain-containing protein [Alicyclobacillus sacchari]